MKMIRGVVTEQNVFFSQYSLLAFPANLLNMPVSLIYLSLHRVVINKHIIHSEPMDVLRYIHYFVIKMKHVF